MVSSFNSLLVKKNSLILAAKSWSKIDLTLILYQAYGIYKPFLQNTYCVSFAVNNTPKGSFSLSYTHILYIFQQDRSRSLKSFTLRYYYLFYGIREVKLFPRLVFKNNNLNTFSYGLKLKYSLVSFNIWVIK